MVSLSPEQVKALALEVKAWTDSLDRPDAWHIESIEQYYTFLPVEVYNVHFTDDVTLLFIRDTYDGQLISAPSLTYRAPAYTHKAYISEIRRNLAEFFADVARFVEQHAPGERVSYTRNDRKEVMYPS